MDEPHALLEDRARYVRRLVTHSSTCAPTGSVGRINPPFRPSMILRPLQPHTTADLEPGLPKEGVSGSNHVSLATIDTHTCFRKGSLKPHGQLILVTRYRIFK